MANKELIDRLTKLFDEYSKTYNETPLAGMSAEEIHISHRAVDEIATFENWYIIYQNPDDGSVHLQTEINGYLFTTVMTKFEYTEKLDEWYHS